MKGNGKMSDCVLAGIVTYNPDIALLEKNILAVVGQVDQVVVVDNHSANIQEIENLCVTYHVLLTKNMSNQGIAKAMNQIFQVAEKKGFQWVLTLDQDSILPERFVERSKKMQKEKPELEIGITAPRIYDDNTNTFLKTGSAEYDSYVSHCISSGSFIQVGMYQEIGGFDELLFIDMVDIDFCIRARLAGYKILVLHDNILRHSLGMCQKKRLFGLEIGVMQHSAERKYYMVRNRIICARRYARYKDTYKIHAVNVIIYYFISTILYERQKLKKCFCIVKGIIAGIVIRKSKVMKIMQRECFWNQWVTGG